MTSTTKRQPRSGWLARLVQRFRGKWPKRRVRPLVRVQMTNDMKRRPRELALILNQAGYTSGDKIVVMLESDFERVAELAHRKVHSPIMAVAWYALEHDRLARLSLNASSDRIPGHKEDNH